MLLNILVLNTLFLVLLAAPIYGQYSVNSGLRPDVTFGEDKDRFDLTSLMDYQNKYFRAQEGNNYRRKHSLREGKTKDNQLKVLKTGDNDRNWILGSYKSKQKLAKRIKEDADKEINNLANMMLLKLSNMRRFGEDDFAFHDNMESDGGDVYDFNENLGGFYTITRRSGAPEDGHVGYRRIGTDPDMYNYAFPIDMQVNGYLVAPVAA